MMAGDFSSVITRAAGFNQELQQIKKRELRDIDFDWYPYGTLTTLEHLDHLLTGANRQIFSGKKRILDAGCQDGELSFLLESLGHEVVALDYPTYNHNGMRGVRALKSVLNSCIELIEVDLDRQFTLPHDVYDIALLLGVLYHIRNPFYLLEELARRARYCLLSTRIARCFPDGTLMPSNMAMAYLLQEHELNNDETNYFIFSEKGLRTLLARTYWEIREYLSVGAANSDPVRPDRDERIFCLLESRYDRLTNVELLNGWHEPEGSGWRWTKKSFAARMRWHGAVPPRAVELNFFLPDRLIEQFERLKISESINGRAVSPEVYRSAGTHKMIRALPSQDCRDELILQFSLSSALPPEEHDGRERGIIVTSLRVE